jgi:hypothetical protein
MRWLGRFEIPSGVSKFGGGGKKAGKENMWIYEP